jgi:hypothetical protein
MSFLPIWFCIQTDVQSEIARSNICYARYALERSTPQSEHGRGQSQGARGRKDYSLTSFDDGSDGLISAPLKEAENILLPLKMSKAVPIDFKLAKGDEVDVHTAEGTVSLLVDEIDGDNIEVHGFKRGVRYEGIIRIRAKDSSTHGG